MMRESGNQFHSSKKSIAVKHAMSCKGWTNEYKLSLLYDLVHATRNMNGDILEIGSAFGRSTVLLGLASKKTIWSIDPHTGGRKFIERNENQNSFEEFVANLNRFDLKERIKILKNTTQDVIEKQLIPENIRFSFVFIDGLHTVEGVNLDFKLAYKHLMQKGILAFDDYFANYFVDYAEAIDVIVRKRGLDLILEKSSGLVYLIK